ncbi:hypothetical protein Tco_0722920 [Tanacetum coccineum]
MTRLSTESKTSLAIAANLSELEIKKILINKMESNKSIHRSDAQKNLYKAVVTRTESDKLVLDNLLVILSYTPLDFSAFELMKGTCKSLVELEYFFEEVYKGICYDGYYKCRSMAVTKLRLSNAMELTQNLNVEDRLAFGVSLRMFTRSIVIQRHVEDLQLGVERMLLQLYFPSRGLYISEQRQEEQLMRIDELHKFSDGTLDDVRTALNDCLKGIRMEYLP